LRTLRAVSIVAAASFMVILPQGRSRGVG